MARVIEEGDIDFRAYEQATEVKVKIRQASVFLDDLKAQFARRDQAPVEPSMGSTKLRNLLHFRPGEVTAWAGFNGHRKSMFAGQVALDLMAESQKVLIASMEMAPERTLARMARQAAAVRFPNSRWLEQFSRWTDGRLWLFDHMGRITPSTCIAVCRYFADELAGQHVFIDSMMMVCASEESMDEQKQFVTDLCRLAQETDLHVHLITHCRKPQHGEDKPPTKYDIRGAAAISDQASNVVTVWANKAKRDALEKNRNDTDALAKPDALVSVEKQRNGSWEGKVSLWFDEVSMRFCDDRTQAVEAMDLGHHLEAAA
jgi:twinkle protein